MLTGNELHDALSVYPKYDETICTQSTAIRLMSLSDMYDVFISNTMAKEIYSKLYLSMVRSLNKKQTKLATQQYYENAKVFKGQHYESIIGGADSFSIIGSAGIGKSASISRAIQLLGGNQIIETNNPYAKIIPAIVVQTPQDASIKSLLLTILQTVDNLIGSSYYNEAMKNRPTVDLLIGKVAQVSLNHIGTIILDEVQHAALHSRNGANLVSFLTQLINMSSVSICLVGTPECKLLFSQAKQLARRTIGVEYRELPYGKEFIDICEKLFEYQYVQNKTPFTEAYARFLYEHSNGNISIVVSLLKEAQELAIIDGREVLNIETLSDAYKQRLSMLHDYILPQTKRYTPDISPNKLDLLDPCIFGDTYSLVTLINTAKDKGIDIVEYLDEFITIERVSL